MTWTAPSGLKAQLARLWERGVLLEALATGEARFPLRLTLKSPSSTELAGQFEAARAWIASLASIPHIRIEWREFRHPVMGTQTVPQTIWVDSLDAAAAWLGKRGEIARFAEIVEAARTRQPALLPWLARKPLPALELAGEWARLLDVVEWAAQHPRPGIYLRQVDIPGVHSKFIEARRGPLAELLDLVLPRQAVSGEHRGMGQFAARYGFLDKPVRIRFRMLDEAIGLVPGAAHPDVTLDAASFAKLALPVRRVFVTENETNFLAFPPIPESIAVFGAGYGWDALAEAEWLARCTIHYWGDIDTHGFAILDQLRGKFAHVESLLMDRETLMAHQSLWDEEEKQALHDLARLTATERALFDELRDNRIRKGLRLEQERVGYGWLMAALEGVAGRAG